MNIFIKTTHKSHKATRARNLDVSFCMVKCWVNTAKRFDRGTEVKPGVFSLRAMLKKHRVRENLQKVHLCALPMFWVDD